MKQATKDFIFGKEYARRKLNQEICVVLTHYNSLSSSLESLDRDLCKIKITVDEHKKILENGTKLTEQD